MDSTFSSSDKKQNDTNNNNSDILTLFSCCEYDKVDYWDSRYISQSYDNPNIPSSSLNSFSFEWYFGYKKLRSILKKYVRSVLLTEKTNDNSKDESHTNNDTLNIVVLGCGNSMLSYELYQDIDSMIADFDIKFVQISNADISRVLIDQMKEQWSTINPQHDETNDNTTKKEMTWKQMNCMYMTYTSNKFDIAIDKGLLDCLYCHDDPTQDIQKYCEEVERILHDGGTWIIVSFAPPEDSRLEYIENELNCDKRLYLDDGDYYISFECIDCVVVDNEEQEYYVYICKKNMEKVKRKQEMIERRKKRKEREILRSAFIMKKGGPIATGHK